MRSLSCYAPSAHCCKKIVFDCAGCLSHREKRDRDRQTYRQTERNGFIRCSSLTIQQEEHLKREKGESVRMRERKGMKNGRIDGTD
jgi:hypothetical protein